MSIKPEDQPGGVAGNADYPVGRARNSTASGARDGYPWEEDIINDWYGFFQGLMSVAGLTASGNPDTVQLFDYLKTVSVQAETVHNMTSDADYSLTIFQSVAAIVKITDTSVFLTVARNIIVPDQARVWVFDNQAVQNLTIKTAAGAGVLIAPGMRVLLHSDGTDVLIVSEVVDPFSEQLLNIEDQKTSGTDGGTFTTGADQTRILNTVITNEISGASLSSNQIILPAGEYWVEFEATARAVIRHQAWFQNVTDVIEEITGSSQLTNVADSVGNKSTGFGRVVIAGTKTFELQHRCEATRITDGFGTSVGSVFAVAHERYSSVRIWKLS